MKRVVVNLLYMEIWYVEKVVGTYHDSRITAFFSILILFFVSNGKYI